MCDPIKTARQVLRKGWDLRLPVDVSSIANSIGIIVSFSDLKDDNVTAVSRVVSERCYIVINQNVEMHKVSFIIAHAMYHLLQNRGGDAEYVDCASDYFEGVVDSEQRRANAFASRIIAPERALKILVQRKGVTSVNSLANCFNCAPALVNKVISGIRW